MQDILEGENDIDDDDDDDGRTAREMVCKTAEILFGCRGSCEVWLKGEESRGWEKERERGSEEGV